MGKRRTRVRVEKDVLSEALKDIAKELNKLKRDKVSMNRKLSQIDNSLLGIRDKEAMLRDKITKLIAEESTLTKKKSASQGRLLELKEKLSKVEKIKSELREV